MKSGTIDYRGVPIDIETSCGMTSFKFTVPGTHKPIERYKLVKIHRILDAHFRNDDSERSRMSEHILAGATIAAVVITIIIAIVSNWKC